MYKEIEIVLTPDQINDQKVLKAIVGRKIKNNSNFDFSVLKKSIDARGKRPVYRLRIAAFSVNERPTSFSTKEIYQNVKDAPEIHIVGAGPAGYFAGLECLEKGLKPIILDRGLDVRKRRKGLRSIQQEGIVDPNSNYCFGEGGAGTYSDGKLYTRSHKRGSIKKILQQLVDHGAHQDILIDAHPHIGSNKLPKIIASIRDTIENHGGQILFDHHVVDFDLDNNKITNLILKSGQRFSVNQVVLATGHSARDIYQLFYDKKLAIEAKNFALGVRIEHPQKLIDQQQYNHSPRHENLPAASYSIVAQVNEIGVYSFCMCPGGLIVPAATAPGELVVNGMSLSRRDSPFANSGLVTEITEEDWKDYNQFGPLAGLKYQAAAEKKIFDFGDGSQKAPAQRVPDFIAGRVSKSLNKTSYIPGIYSAPMHKLLPKRVSDRLREGLKMLNKKIKGYTSEQGQIIGIESRTSSPVRIPRSKDTLQHIEIENLYPCAEGAGYAGGILSAAMDGQRIVDKIAQLYYN